MYHIAGSIMQSTSAPTGSFLAADGLHASETFRGKLCRYLFPRNLLKEPHGDVYLERSILRDNVETLRRHSGHYFRVHAVLTGALAASALLVAQVSTGFAAAGVVVLVPEMCLFIIFASIAAALRLK
jgi:hypothetical protein